MASRTLDELLKLSPGERADLALALWESLSDSERAHAVALPPEQEAEIDRRSEEHIADPSSAVPWEEVRRKLKSSA